MPVQRGPTPFVGEDLADCVRTAQNKNTTLKGQALCKWSASNHCCNPLGHLQPWLWWVKTMATTHLLGSSVLVGTPFLMAFKRKQKDKHQFGAGPRKQDASTHQNVPGTLEVATTTPPARKYSSMKISGARKFSTAAMSRRSLLGMGHKGKPTETLVSFRNQYGESAEIGRTHFCWGGLMLTQFFFFFKSHHCGGSLQKWSESPLKGDTPLLINQGFINPGLTL